ncbi:MAG: hypothetical protein AAGI53_11270 [Planctomycetota bacterium]
MSTRLIVLALVAGFAMPLAAQPGRVQMDRERLAERLDERIVDVERMLEKMKSARVSLDEGAEPADVIDEILDVQRDLLERGPLANLMARRDERGGGMFQNPRGERPDRRNRLGPAGPRDDADRKDVDAFLERNVPEGRHWLNKLRETDHPLADRMVRRIEGRVFELITIEKSDPTLASLKIAEVTSEVRVMQAARALGRASESDRDEAKDALRVALSDQFDAHLAILRHDAVRAAERIDDLEREIVVREEEKATFLETKLEEMEFRVRAFERLGGGRRDRIEP